MRKDITRTVKNCNNKLLGKGEVETKVLSVSSGGSEASSFFYAHTKAKQLKLVKHDLSSTLSKVLMEKFIPATTSLYGVSNSFFKHSEPLMGHCP